MNKYWQVLHEARYKERAASVAAALSPWQALAGPVERAVWWLEQVTNYPTNYSIRDFYQKYPTAVAQA